MLGLTLISLLHGCGSINRQPPIISLNSRYNDEKPSLSGDGRWLAFISNRNGNSQIVLYDLQNQRFVDLPGLNSNDAIADSPSLSRTGRYLVYLYTGQGKPEIALYDRIIKRSELMTQGYRSWLRNPQISPDGRYIVFETSRRGQWDIEVLDRGPNIELDVANGIPVKP
jgi:Tol biopolymer transport system component